MAPAYRTLVDPATLAGHLGDPGWRIVDCRFALGDPEHGRRQYAQGRIPGAVYAHLETDLSAPATPTRGRHPLPDAASFAQRLGDWGISPGTQVVVYDDSFGSVAARLWWMLGWAGHDKVALLDGGWPAWQRLKLPRETGAPQRETGSGCCRPYPVRPDATRLVDAATVEGLRLAADCCLLDARPEERFRGKREPFDRVAGHIPGSRNRCHEDNLGFDGCLLDAAELRADFLARLDGVAPERVVHTCGSGVTACHNLLAMEHAGLPGSRLYAGSWSEWTGDPTRAVARGDA